MAILIAGFGMYFLLTQGSLDNTATKVLVSKGGVPLSTFFLDADRRVDLKQFGVNMVLEVRDGRVRIASSDCKQQLCVRHGWIEQPREAVFCLPNHIAVELSGDGAEYDAISR
ncbi:MAG: NusG domain II-containing protein [Desulfobulbaceae bacterium]|nr:NusG domain II-containing protein [Desulfobulbaceae bacterium]